MRLCIKCGSEIPLEHDTRVNDLAYHKSCAPDGTATIGMKQIVQIEEDRRRYIQALEAVLLFHSGGAWNSDKADTWRELTGQEVVSPETLCLVVRRALKNAN